MLGSFIIQISQKFTKKMELKKTVKLILSMN